MCYFSCVSDGKGPFGYPLKRPGWRSGPGKPARVKNGWEMTEIPRFPFFSINYQCVCVHACVCMCMRVRSSARVCELYQLSVSISPGPVSTQSTILLRLKSPLCLYGIRMSKQITIAEKLQVKFTIFFHFECLEALRNTVCDCHIVTIKNVVIRAS